MVTEDDRRRPSIPTDWTLLGILILGALVAGGGMVFMWRVSLDTNIEGAINLAQIFAPAVTGVVGVVIGAMARRLGG